MQIITPAAGLAWAVDAANDSQRNARYQHYRRYYEGDHDLAFATEKFRTSFGALFRTFAYNRCAAAIEAMTDRLAIERFSAGDGSEREIEQRAAAIWAANAMQERETEVYREAFVCGDAYVLVWPDPETRQPIIWPQEAHLCRVRYADEHPNTVILAQKSWREQPSGAARVRLNVYFPERIERWVSAQTVQPGAGFPKQPEQYLPFRDDEAGPVVPNPWQTVPIFHFTNSKSGDTLGMSELRDIIPINDALNKTLADMMIAEEFSAFTQKVVMGVDADPMTDEEGRVLNSAGAFNQEQLRKLALGADRIIALASEQARIGEWTATQLEQFEKLAEGWDARISRVSKVPVHYLTLSSDFPSGRALRTAEAPFVAKLEKKQRPFSEVWEQIMRLALLQDGAREVPELRAVWNSAAPLAEEDKLDLVMQMTTVGIPLPVALRRIGWDEDEIAEVTETARRQDGQSASRQDDESARRPDGKTASRPVGEYG